MDPLSVILSAVVTGAATALKPTAEQAVKDAYAGLKRLIVNRYGDKADVSSAVEKVEAKPESEGRQLTLKEELTDAGADQDEELVQLAQALLEALKSTAEGRAAVSKYQVDVAGGQVGVVGDQTHVEGGIHFGPSGKEGDGEGR